MRLWSLHPQYLDPPGLVALWREALLARKVLLGETKGYRHHPQLERFCGSVHPLQAIDRYLRGVFDEAARRGYLFDATKLRPAQQVASLQVTAGQLAFEREHLLAKLERRNQAWLQPLHDAVPLLCHPLFQVVPGPVETWERAAPLRSPTNRKEKIYFF